MGTTRCLDLRFILFLFLMSLFSFNAEAQLDKLHYIPPFFAPHATANNVKDHWIVLSTQEESAFIVTIYRGETFFKSVEVSKAFPRLIYLGSGFTSASNPTGIVDESGINQVLTQEGFMLSADKPFFTAIYQRSNSQGDVLTSKGETALGVEFYSGHIFGAYGNENARAQFLTVMATFDNTQITFSNPRVKWDGQSSNTFTVTLNKNESYALGAIYASAQLNDYEINDYNGTKITSTKPIAVNSGSWMGSANESNQQDIGLDQLVPRNFVGKDYIVVQGYGTELGEKVIVVATKANTSLYVNDTLEHVFVKSGDYYVIGREEYNSSTHNLSIRSNENIYVYQTLSGKESDVSVGMCFIPPLSCLSNREVNISYANQIGNPMLNIITELGATVEVNGAALTATPQPVVGNPDWVTYRLDNADLTALSDPPSVFEIVSTSAVNVALAFQDGAIGGAGFYSGFGVSPQLLVAPSLEGTSACYPANAVCQADGYDDYIWYYNNVVIAGQTAGTLYPDKTGQYRVSGRTSCGVTKASDPFILKTCLSVEGGGVFPEDTGDVAVIVRLGLPSELDVEYWYRTVSITAKEGEDYQTATGIRTIRAGALIDTFYVELLNDERYEKSDEQFELEVYFSDNATIQNGLLSFTITNDDPLPVLNLPAFASVEEDADSLLVSLLKVGETQEDVLINYSTQDGSAIAGTHYASASGTLTFAPKEYVKQIKLPIIDNEELNASHLFNLNVSDPVGATLGQSQSQITIFDNEVVVACLECSLASHSVLEGDSFKVRVHLDTVVADYVSFFLSLNHLTTNAQDFPLAQVDGWIIPPGEQDLDVWIKTQDDALPEGDEVAQLELVNVTNARSCSGTLDFTLLNNDYVPQLQQDNFSCKEDKSFSGFLLENDLISGDTPVVVTIYPPALGQIAGDGKGYFEYLPASNFYGSVVFNYSVKDMTGDSAFAKVQILVQQENDVPIAINDTVSTLEDSTLIIYPLMNDLDIDNSGLAIESVDGNRLGKVDVYTDHLVYTPHPDANGTEVLNYAILDTEGDPSYAKIYMTILPVNDIPVAVKDSFKMVEDAPTTTLDVLQNDQDPDKHGLHLLRVSDVTGGSIIFANEKVEYTLWPNFWGNAGFSYTMADGEGDTATSSVGIAVEGVNDYPTAFADTLATDEDVPLLLDLFSNDWDDDQRGLTIARIDSPLHAHLQASGTTYIYRPSPDFYGVDSFRYFIEDWNLDRDFAWVNVTVNPVNDAPRASVDTFVLNEDAPQTLLPVLLNDADPDNSGLVVSQVFGLTNAHASPQSSAVAFTIAPDFFGETAFYYVVSDAEGDKDTAEVLIEILPLNDAPKAIKDTFVAWEDTELKLDVMANDVDVDKSGLTLDSVGPAIHGRLYYTADTLCYLADTNYCGVDSFIYVIKDGEDDVAIAWAILQVTCVNEDPIAYPDSAVVAEDIKTLLYPLINDEDPDGGGIRIWGFESVAVGSVTIEGGELYYVSSQDYNGEDSLIYTIIDAEGDTSSARIHITVIPVNDYPIANNDVLTLTEDIPLYYDLLANDTDVEDSLPSGFELYGKAKWGEVTIVGGQLFYKPDTNVWGKDTLQYVAWDSNKLRSNLATVYITIDSVNEFPILKNRSATLLEDGRDSTYLLTLAQDPDFSGLQVVEVGGLQHGTPYLAHDAVIYFPDSNYYGADTLWYDVEDGEGDRTRAYLFYSITPVNDVPVIYDDYLSTDEDVMLECMVLSNDHDEEDAIITRLEMLRQPKHGRLVQEGTRLFYTPVLNSWGNDTLSYIIKDKEGQRSEVAMVYLTVDSVNEAPYMRDIFFNVDEDAANTIDVLPYVDDFDYSGITIHYVSDGAHGTTFIWGDAFIYTPLADFYGRDTFTIEVADGEGDLALAQVSVAVLSINDAPVARDDYYLNSLGGVKESSAIVMDVMNNDSDVDEVPLQGRVTVDVAPLYGRLTYTPMQDTIIYTPDSSFVGMDTLYYRVQDTLSASSKQAMVVIFTDSFNYVPRAVNDSFRLDEDAFYVFNPMANDWDVHGDSLWPTVNNLLPTGGPFAILASAYGSIELRNDTTWIYTPSHDFFGEDYAFYQANDSYGGVTTAKICMTVNPVNDLPRFSTQEDTLLYVENSGVKYLWSDAMVLDVDDTTLHQIDLLLEATDVSTCALQLNDTLGVTVVESRDSVMLRWEMTGQEVSLARWSQILQHIGFENTSDDDTITRRVTLHLWDDSTAYCDTLGLSILMDAVNDAPQNIERPQLSGAYLPDSVLHCDTGLWFDVDGELVYCFEWYYAENDEVQLIPNACKSELLVTDEIMMADALWCEVKATDNGFPLPEITTYAFTDSLQPANYPPHAVLVSPDTVFRSMLSGDVVGLLSALDRDSLQQHHFSLLTAHDTLEIHGDTLVLAQNAFGLELEQLTVQLRVTDDGLVPLSRDLSLTLTFVIDLMPEMRVSYPAIDTVGGDMVRTIAQADKPGFVHYGVYPLEQPMPAISEWVGKEPMLADQEFKLATFDLESQEDYIFYMALVDTSEHFWSDIYRLPFQTKDVVAPQFIEETPVVVFSGIDSAAVKVVFDEPVDLYYLLYEEDTLFFADTLGRDTFRIDTALVWRDSVMMIQGNDPAIFALDSLQSQMRYRLEMNAVDTSANASETTLLYFTTRDTVTPNFRYDYPQMVDVSEGRLTYSVKGTEGGMVYARLLSNYGGKADFSQAYKSTLYNDSLAMVENEIASFRTENLSLDGIFLLYLMMRDSANNYSPMKSLGFVYPAPFGLELFSEVVFNNEGLRFKSMTDAAEYCIYNLSGDCVSTGRVTTDVKELPIPLLEEGVFLIYFATPSGTKSFKFLKINVDNPNK